MVQGKAYFAVKKRGETDKVAPTLIAIVQSYDAAIKLADRRNELERVEHFYPSVHYR